MSGILITYYYTLQLYDTSKNIKFIIILNHLTYLILIFVLICKIKVSQKSLQHF